MPPKEDDFVDNLFEASVQPERFDALIERWDERFAQTSDDLEFRLSDIRRG